MAIQAPTPPPPAWSRCSSGSTPSLITLANVNTTVSSATGANFEDTFYLNPKLPGAEDADGQRTPTGIHLGLGSRIEGTQIDFRQGSFDTTNKDLDLAIEGRGFFQVKDPVSQQILYTRSGNFSTNSEGSMVLASAGIGRLIEPPVTFPPDTVKYKSARKERSRTKARAIQTCSRWAI